MYRLMAYQRERFPLAAHGPVIAVFGASAVGYSFLLRGSSGWPSSASLGVSMLVSLLFFFQLRVADEFKDYEDDRRYRPYRPVPRGLVTLGELYWLAMAAAVVQVVSTAWLRPSLLWFLIAAWLYLGLMTKEFLVPKWLKAHPVAYLLSHMVILPLIVFFGTACDWMGSRLMPGAGIIWFLGAGFCNGIVMEIGRKIRAPASEEAGVDTYSRLWGVRGAVVAWWTALGAGFVCAVMAAKQAGNPMLCAGVGIVCLGAALLAGMLLVSKVTKKRAGYIEPLSGIWTLVQYLVLGIVPLIPGIR